MLSCNMNDQLNQNLYPCNCTNQCIDCRFQEISSICLRPNSWSFIDGVKHEINNSMTLNLETVIMSYLNNFVFAVHLYNYSVDIIIVIIPKILICIGYS